MRRLVLSFALVALALPSGAACQQPGSDAAAEWPRIDAELMLDDLLFLSSDALAGRRTGSEGNARAREHIVATFQQIGLVPVGEGFTHEFTFTGRRDGAEYRGTNVAGDPWHQARAPSFIPPTTTTSGSGSLTGRDSIQRRRRQRLRHRRSWRCPAPGHRPAHPSSLQPSTPRDGAPGRTRVRRRRPSRSTPSSSPSNGHGRTERRRRALRRRDVPLPFLLPTVERIALTPVRSPATTAWIAARAGLDQRLRPARSRRQDPFLYFGVEDHPTITARATSSTASARLTAAARPSWPPSWSWTGTRRPSVEKAAPAGAGGPHAAGACAPSSRYSPTAAPWAPRFHHPPAGRIRCPWTGSPRSTGTSSAT